MKEWSRREFIAGSIATSLGVLPLLKQEQVKPRQPLPPAPTPRPTETVPSVIIDNKLAEDHRIRESNKSMLSSVEEKFQVKLYSNAQLYEMNNTPVPDRILLGSKEWDTDQLLLLTDVLNALPDSYYQSPNVSSRVGFTLGSVREDGFNHYSDLTTAECCFETVRSTKIADVVGINTSFFDPKRRVISFIVLTHELGHVATPIVGSSYPNFPRQQAEKLYQRQDEWMNKLLPILGVFDRKQADAYLKNHIAVPVPVYSPSAEWNNLNDYTRYALRGGFAEFPAVLAQLFVQGPDQFQKIVGGQYQFGTTKAQELYQFTKDVTFRGDAEYSQLPITN